MAPAKTHIERAAAATALSRVAHPQAAAAVTDALANLSLDEPEARVAVYARAAVRQDAAGAERTLLNSSHTRAVLRTVGLAEKDGLPQRGCC